MVLKKSTSRKKDKKTSDKKFQEMNRKNTNLGRNRL